MNQNQNDQAFLNTAFQHARDSDDENAEKLALLHYQQAVLETLQSFQPCEECAHFDLTLLKKRVEKLLHTTENYTNTVAVVPMQQVQQIITESRTLLGDVAQLCMSCQARLQQTILATFRRLHTAP